MKTQKKLLFFCLVVSLCCVFFAFSASAATTMEEYMAESNLDYSKYEALDDDQKAAFDTAFVVASGEYANPVAQNVVDALANAATVLDYVGLQTRLEGIPGIRSMYDVNNEAVDESIVAFGAIMAIANGTNTPTNLVVDEAYAATGERARSVVVYDGEYVGNFLNAANSQFAFTTTYKAESQTCENMHVKELVYRGFVACKVDDVTYILYVDGVGNNFGKSTSTYGVGASMLEIATYFADDYQDNATLALVRSADDYKLAATKMPTLTAAGAYSYVCAGCGDLATAKSEGGELPMTAGADEVAETVAAIEGETNKFTVTASEAGIYRIVSVGSGRAYKVLYNEAYPDQAVRGYHENPAGTAQGYVVYLNKGENTIYFSGTIDFEKDVTVTPLLITEDPAYVAPAINSNGAAAAETQSKAYTLSGLEIDSDGFYKLSAFVSFFNAVKLTDITLTSGDYSVSFTPDRAVNANDGECEGSGSANSAGFQNLGAVYLEAGSYSIKFNVSGTGNGNHANIGTVFATKLDATHTCEYEKIVSGTTFTYACPICGDVKGVVEFTAPTVDADDFSIDVTDFDGKITVPADKIPATGFYWVTLDGVTVASGGYTYLYNENGKLFASKNRDKAGATYSVYLEAGKDNILTYEGATLTKATFKLAEPTSADTIIMTSGKNDLTANTVANAAFKDNTTYQMRAGSILNYKKTVTVAEDAFFTIGAAVCNATEGKVVFTFTNAAGVDYTASFMCSEIAGATGVTIVTNGSESFRYAADLTAIYLPAGEYSLTVSKVSGGQTSIGVITMNPMDHNHDVTVEYNQPGDCENAGIIGTGCIVCGKGATVVPAGHDFQNTVLDGDANLVSVANCATAATYFKVCSVCGVYSDETFTVGEAGTHVYELALSDNVATYTCAGCGDVKTVDLTYPSADVADFSIDVTDFAGTITVPAANITASGFYWVTLEGVTVAGGGYTYLYNDANGKLFGSKNRDKAGATYSVYLEAGKDNVLTYEGATLTKATFKLAEPTSADTIMMTSGKDDLTANTVASAGFKDNTTYQMRAGSVLNYKKTVTVAENGFFTIGAAVSSDDTAGKVVFTFTNAAGDTYEASFMCMEIAGATGVTIVTNGSESFRYAADLTEIYLPAGEYSLTVSLAGGLHMSIGVITMNPIAHNHDVTVEYNVDATCTTDGMTGVGCIVCGKGATVVPAGHKWDDGVVIEPSCVADGATLYTCTVCSDTKIDNVVPPAGHKWDDANDAVCNACGTVRKYSITPTFETTDNKTWTITVPGSQIQATGIYRFKIAGTITAGGYVTVTSSSDANFLSRVKFSAVGDDGYAASWHEVFIAAVDANEDGVNDDVTVTLTDASNAQTITAMSLELIGEVVAYTYEKVGTEGTIASIAAGTYTVATFANGANNWSCTVNVNGTDLTDSQKASGVSQNGNYYNGSTQHNGSTNSAGFMNMGTVSFDADATDVKTLVTLTGDIEAGTNNKAPVYLMNLVD